MKRLHFNTAIFFSVLSLGIVACSDDDKVTNTGNDGGGNGDGSTGTGGSTSGSGGSTSATGGKTGSGGSTSASGGSTSATGGATGSGGGTSTDGGSPEGATGDAGDPCTKYCADIAATCTGANAQFGADGGDADAECMTACAAYDNSDPNAKTGDTFGCRRLHLNNAMASEAAAGTHCGHAGPTGNGVCQ